MCRCTPNIRTPYCSRPGCLPPSLEREQEVNDALKNPCAEVDINSGIKFADFEIRYHDGKVNYLNPELFFKQVWNGNTRPEALARIVEIHKLLYMTQEASARLMELKEYIPARQAADFVDVLDRILQRLWGFPEDQARRTHWCRIKGCLCEPTNPLLQNRRTYNLGCPFHGNIPSLQDLAACTTVIPKVKDVLIPNSVLKVLQKAKKL
jgi:hypothetical protein